MVCIVAKQQPGSQVPDRVAYRVADGTRVPSGTTFGYYNSMAMAGTGRQWAIVRFRLRQQTLEQFTA